MYGPSPKPPVLLLQFSVVQSWDIYPYPKSAVVLLQVSVVQSWGMRFAVRQIVQRELYSVKLEMWITVNNYVTLIQTVLVSVPV